MPFVLLIFYLILFHKNDLLVQATKVLRLNIWDILKYNYYFSYTKTALYYRKIFIFSSSLKLPNGGLINVKMFSEVFLKHVPPWKASKMNVLNISIVYKKKKNWKKLQNKIKQNLLKWWSFNCSRNH